MPSVSKVNKGSELKSPTFVVATSEGLYASLVCFFLVIHEWQNGRMPFVNNYHDIVTKCHVSIMSCRHWHNVMVEALTEHASVTGRYDADGNASTPCVGCKGAGRCVPGLSKLIIRLQVESCLFLLQVPRSGKIPAMWHGAGAYPGVFYPRKRVLKTG